MAQRSDRVERPSIYWEAFPRGKLLQLNDPYKEVGRKGRVAAATLGPIIRRIIKERDVRGWSRPELGRRAGVRQQTVWNIENGETWPDFVTLAALCDALELDLKVAKRRA